MKENTPETEDDGAGDQHAEELVGGREEGLDHDGGAKELGPVEGRDRVKAETANRTKDGSDGNRLGVDPVDPVEV